jgi:uncharacterized membrane protein YfcA
VNDLWLLLLPIGVAVGAFSAAFGIGGGLLMVPVLVFFYGLDQHAAQGTSLVVIVPTAIAGAVAHHRRGLLDWRLALYMAGGGLFGVFAGARLALATDAELLQSVFGAVVIAAGLRLAAQGIGERRAEP